MYVAQCIFRISVLELARTTKCAKKDKCVIRRWHLEQFGDDEVKTSIIRGMVSCFTERVPKYIDKGMVGSELVNDALAEWKALLTVKQLLLLERI